MLNSVQICKLLRWRGHRSHWFTSRHVMWMGLDHPGQWPTDNVWWMFQFDKARTHTHATAWVNMELIALPCFIVLQWNQNLSSGKGRITFFVIVFLHYLMKTKDTFNEKKKKKMLVIPSTDLWLYAYSYNRVWKWQRIAQCRSKESRNAELCKHDLWFVLVSIFSLKCCCGPKVSADK